jgi:hypothetical protein
VVHVQPNARRTQVAGRHGDAIKIRVAAPPVDGAANAELVRFLAEHLNVPRSAFEIVRGGGGRRKQVRVAGYDHRLLVDRLQAPELRGPP